MVKILVTGSDGRFGKILRKVKTRYKFIFKDKKELNILSQRSIIQNIKKIQTALHSSSSWSFKANEVT
tara:strand:- start:435 stop:638 length:204 start_codon:yes stop_codon:yes gene_type:complete